ncbi:MAG: helix-turn-helix domain-containing protein [Puniceicoccales bacterium]|jgi:transcriptional regulator with XRE-family HTH domain|nr:helix-turn-helix domain-containing protein [Puniceicoccales bacterium]
MQSTIGKVLSERRLKLGFSLEEVAEATKIRIDYLKAIEQEQLDFDLPDIYKRGFIRIYAEHLGLDLKEVMSSCPIPPYESLVSSEKRREMVSTVARKQAAYVAIEPETMDKESTVEDDHLQPSTGGTPYRTILMVAGVVVTILLLIIGISLLSRKSAGTKKEASSIVTSFEKIAPQREILLRAKGAAKLIVRDRDSKERLYTGSLKDGEERYVEYEKPIQVYYDKGELLSIEMANGEILHPEKGRGGIEIK